MCTLIWMLVMNPSLVSRKFSATVYFAFHKIIRRVFDALRWHQKKKKSAENAITLIKIRPLANKFRNVVHSLYFVSLWYWLLCSACFIITVKNRSNKIKMLNEAHVLTIANVDKIKLEYMIKDQDTNVESDIDIDAM